LAELTLSEVENERLMRKERKDREKGSESGKEKD